jgi:predicted ATPase/class 3 adenylate cyclase
MSALPTGTVTFLFSDIEGSTRLVQELGEAYAPLLAKHRELIGSAVQAEGGAIFGSEGDALFAAFASAAGAVRAAAVAQRALAAHRWPANAEVRVRMGIHTGEATLTGDNYVGLTLHQVARVMNAGHGGQVLVSAATYSLVGDDPGGGLGLRDSGEHRLKDLAQPVRLHQLVGDGLADGFPPLRTLSGRPNNLPVQLTSFVGRAELDEAAAALKSTRLLTLSGPGGTGKTRLALQVAAESLDDFPDGTWFVALDAVTDPDLVPAVIASTVGAAEIAGKTPLETLSEHLRAKRCLLVLDNFEQVVDAGPTISQLLRAAPELKVIVTSRIVLRVSGEHELAVPPLALPATDGGDRAADVTRVGASIAVRLFVERAQAVHPDFELGASNAAAVAQIVNRLDGLPLAIELAAARMRVLPVEAILARLDNRLGLLTGGARDLPARQQTLRGAIDWSYEMLEPAEQALFERFSVFAGGAFLAEAEEVCTMPGSGLEVLDGLSSLADKSLVRAIVAGAEEPRFAMLATIREYGAERLLADGTAAEVRQRHAYAFDALVARCAGLLTGPEGKVWQDRLETDHDNLRAALDWAKEATDTALAMRLVSGLWRFWQARGHLHEGRSRADEALAMPGVADQPALLRARAYGASGSIRYWQGEFVAANAHYEPALEAARETGDKAELAEALYNYGFAPTSLQSSSQDERYRHARPFFDQALELYRELGDDRGMAGAEWALAISSAAERDLDAALAHGTRALETYRRLNDPFGIGWALHMLSLYWVAGDDLDKARECADEALGTFAKARDLSGSVVVAYDMGLIAARQGDRERAVRIGGAVDALTRAAGVDVIGDGFDFLHWHPPGRPDDAAGQALWDEGSTWSVDQLVAYAAEETGAPG